MTIYKLKDIVAHARKNSPFYQELYKDLPENIDKVEQLPLLDQKKFWTAFRIGGDRLLTGELDDGVVFKSGGTSGNPKYSVFTSDEWRTFTTAFGTGMVEGGLESGEKLANIFYVGDLYASFIFIKDSVENSPVTIMQFPLGGGTSPEKIVQTLAKFQIDSIAGVPTSLIQVAEYIKESKAQKNINLKKMLYGGEKLFPDQIEMIHEILPDLKIQSIGYASVDAGLLGYIDETCAEGEHKVFGKETIVELVDEDSGEVITETGREGKLIVTNLTRKLMPILRYPAGDCAEWTEEAHVKSRKFLLKGRSNEGARVGPVSVYLEDIRKILSAFKAKLPYTAFQMVVSHFDQKDHLELVVASNIDQVSGKKLISELEKLILKERPLLKEVADSGGIHPLKISIVPSDKLQVNERTGKLKPFIDKR